MADDESVHKKAFETTLATLTGAFDKDPVAALVAAGLTAAATYGVHFAEKIHESLPTQQLNAAVKRMAEQDRARELQEHLSELQSRLAKLHEEYGNQAGLLTNVVAVFEAWGEARGRCADCKKQRILIAVLVNALDVPSYNEGLTLAMFDVLEDLEYGDVRVLTTAMSGDRKYLDEFPTARMGDTSYIDPTSMLHLHLKRLMAQGLVHVAIARDGYYTLDVKPTEFGRRLIALIGSDAFRDAEQVSPREHQ